MSKISKKNKDLATRIVTELATYTKEEDGTHGVDVEILPTFPEKRYPSKKKAAEALINHIASELESGGLALSDSWEADNLGKSEE